MQEMGTQADKPQDTGMIASIVPPGEERSVSVLGVQVDMLLTGQDTGGAYSLYRMRVELGAGAPPHVHRWDDEAFTVAEGTFECSLGDEVLTLGAGATISLPRNIPHSFRCVGQTRGIMFGVASPAGHEHFFEDAARLSFPPDPSEAAAVCARHGLELLLTKAEQ